MLFFKEDQFIALKRAELFGITDFIANCGGLLGLFMGVSLLSIVEIIYFCTIRLIYRIKGQTQQQRRDQLINGGSDPSRTQLNQASAVAVREYTNQISLRRY